MRVNGVDVTDLKLEDLRGAVAVVPQDTALNYESIMQNIRCACLNCDESALGTICTVWPKQCQVE